MEVTATTANRVFLFSKPVLVFVFEGLVLVFGFKTTFLRVQGPVFCISRPYLGFCFHGKIRHIYYRRNSIFNALLLAMVSALIIFNYLVTSMVIAMFFFYQNLNASSFFFMHCTHEFPLAMESS